MATAASLVGKQIGRWKVDSLSTTRKAGRLCVNCICECGSTSVVLAKDIVAGKSKSCGCFRIDCLTTHKMTNSREYTSWEAMKFRCLSPTSPQYDDYGGRGITVCERWLKFEEFYADMGPRPVRTTLDRIDVNGNYEPGNCRWATASEQQSNRRNSIILEFNGESLSLADWSGRLGILLTTLRRRCFRGWSAEKILTYPVVHRRVAK